MWRGPSWADGRRHKHPAPSLRTLPSLQLAHEARSGQEATGRTFPQTTGGGELPACTATPSPDKPNPSQERNLSDAHRLISSPHSQTNTMDSCIRLFIKSLNGYFYQPSQITPCHTGHPSHLKHMTCGTPATAVFDLSSQTCTCMGFGFLVRCHLSKALRQKQETQWLSRES